LINPARIIGIVLYLLIFFVFALIAPMIMLWIIGRNRAIMGDLALSKSNQLAFLSMFILIVATAVVAVVT